MAYFTRPYVRELRLHCPVHLYFVSSYGHSIVWICYNLFIHLLLVGMFFEFIVTAKVNTGDMVLSEVLAGGVTSPQPCSQEYWKAGFESQRAGLHSSIT